MSRGPLPSKRCLLSDLPAHQIGDKVRFLGCVDSYGVQTGTLTLSHAFPADKAVKAFVDVKLLLKNLGTAQTDVGQWVHVLGYITSAKKTRGRDTQSLPGVDVGIQALLLWPAQDLDITAFTNSMTTKSP